MSCSTTPPGRRRGLLVLATAAAAATLVAGCSKPAGSGNGSSTGGNGSVKTDAGVTGSTITLGVLTDQTGPYAGASKSLAQARDLFWQGRTVCGRKVEFMVKNHGYKVPDAVTAYAEMKDKVVALDELLGSPEIAQLSKDLDSDEMVSIAASWSSILIKQNPHVVVVGTTYDIEMINGIDYLVSQSKLAKGDKIGHIYDDGEYGADALAGSKAEADANGLTVVEQKVAATDNDLTAAITALKGAGVKAVLLTTTPQQTASAVKTAAANGLDATFLANTPAWSGALLKDEAARPLLEKNVLVSTSLAPFNSDSPGPTELRTKFLAKYPNEAKSSYINYSYAAQQVMYQVLDTACKNKDLTRAGVSKAFQSLASVDTLGLVPTLDFSKPGQIPTRQSYIAKPNAATPGDLDQVKGLFSAKVAETYQP